MLRKIKNFTRRSTAIWEFITPFIMVCLWGLLFQLVGIWKELWNLLKDPGFGVVLLVIILLLNFVGLVNLSSDHLVELGHRKRYFCSKGNPVDKSGLVVLVGLCFGVVIGCVIFFSR